MIIFELVGMFLFLCSGLSLVKTNVAYKCYKKLRAAIHTIDGPRDRITALNLVDIDYAYSYRVNLNPFAWSTKHHYPAAVEYLESMGIEVK